MEKNIRNGILMGLISLGVGLLIIIIANNTIKTNKEKDNNYIEVEATIVKIKPSTDDDSSNNYTTVQYIVEGQIFEATSHKIKASSSDLGNTIKIKYNPENYEEIYYNDGGIPEYFVIFGGGSFILCGIIVIYKSLYLKKSSKNIKYDQTDINHVVGPK